MILVISMRETGREGTGKDTEYIRALMGVHMTGSGLTISNMGKGLRNSQTEASLKVNGQMENC
jgi:hypothetical protein